MACSDDQDSSGIERLGSWMGCNRGGAKDPRTNAQREGGVGWKVLQAGVLYRTCAARECKGYDMEDRDK